MLLGGRAVLVETGVGPRHLAEAARVDAHVAADLSAAVAHLREAVRS